MITTASVAAMGTLVGDPARVAMLQALMDGRALTAAELAQAAGITPQTASGHLAQLTNGGLLAVARQGRHRYHRLATAQVAGLLESLMQIAASAPLRTTRTGPRDEQMRLARTCYDHIAGRLGVALADALIARGWVEVEDDAALVTAEGVQELARLGVDLGSASPRRNRSVPLCRPCLEWSERRAHLAGRLGAALCTHALDRAWIRRRVGSRTLEITPHGQREFRDRFSIEVPLLPRRA
jgi:DNA-binding transcriptional ArsR family regulator